MPIPKIGINNNRIRLSFITDIDFLFRRPIIIENAGKVMNQLAALFKKILVQETFLSQHLSVLIPSIYERIDVVNAASFIIFIR